MEKELDQDVIKATQSSLGKYVKRPPLSDKLLRKPPFRFLHDIMTTVMKTTGFFEGLFEEGELISENVKDRDSKILFLNKVISVLNTTTGKSLAAKPSKIVAGQEPENTNELLQCIAFALDNKLSSKEAVRKYKEGEHRSDNKSEKPKDPVKSIKKSSESKKLLSKSNEKLTINKKDTGEKLLTRNDKEKTNNAKSKQKEMSTKKESPPKKILSQLPKTLTKKNSVEKQNKNDVPGNKGKRKTSIENVNVAHNEDISKIAVNDDDNNTDQDSGVSLEKPDLTYIAPTPISPRLDQEEQVQLNSSYTIAENDINSSLSSQDLMEVDHGNAVNNQHILKENYEIDLKSKQNLDYSTNDAEVHNKEEISNQDDYLLSQSNRSSSPVKDIEKDIYPIDNNTPKSSKVDSTQNIYRPKSVRPSSSRPGAPRLREKHDNIVTGSENLLLGKVNIIVENTPNEEEEDSSIVIYDQQADAPSISKDIPDLQLSSNQQHGALVQQILDSQKEYSQIAGKTEIEWQFGAKKAREAVNQEVEQLRYNIQALSRVTNPLGKVLDHVQEDVEVMRQELQQWRKTYEEASKELYIQKTANEDSLLPLHTKLKQLDADIVEKHEKINDLKILIHKNSSRIEKLLGGGDVQ